MKCLIYCTMGKPYLKKCNHFMTLSNRKIGNEGIELNGKVVAEFKCNKVEEIKCDFIGFGFEKYITETLNTEQLEKLSCLTRQELSDYIGNVNVSLDKTCGYAIHIENLKVFDDPKNINTYKVEDKARNKEVKNLFGKNAIAFKWLEKAPQNMCKVYRLNNNGEDYDEYILISIRPEWVEKIFSGIKTVEIRSKVLKEMLKCQH